MGGFRVLETVVAWFFIVGPLWCKADILRLRSFSRDGAMEHKVYTSSLLGQISVKGRLDCISSCSVMEKCRYALYNPISNQCRLYDNAVDKFEDHRGWQCWASKVMFGNQCSNSSECKYQFGSCVEGNCSCVIGYSYDFAKGQCVTSCSSYGSSFTKYINSIVDEYNTKKITFITRTKCEEACLKERDFVCIFFEYCYVKIGALCNLSNETWSNTEKTARKPGRDSKWDIHYRHCKY